SQRDDMVADRDRPLPARRLADRDAVDQNIELLAAELDHLEPPDLLVPEGAEVGCDLGPLAAGDVEPSLEGLESLFIHTHDVATHAHAERLEQRVVAATLAVDAHARAELGAVDLDGADEPA